ncbi:MAG: homoserine kinase [Chloroflexota bacterium]
MSAVPKLRRASVLVEAPASSANLGPGFDSLALALDLHLRVRVTPLDHGSEQILVEGEGADEIGLDAGNRFLIGLERGLQTLGLEPPVMRIEMENEIPLARGLGSSAAATVAGLLAAEALAGRRIGMQRLHSMATDIDGHPDNVGAALLGGFVIVGRDADGAPTAVRFDPPGALEAALFIPEQPLRTSEMRAALPRRVEHADAAHNVGRAALVAAALAGGRTDLLSAMSEDRLHEPYRALHFPALPALIEAARSAGALGAALSGAGSTVLALCASVAVAEVVGRAMGVAAEKLGLPGRSEVVRATGVGARIITSARSAQGR